MDDIAITDLGVEIPFYLEHGTQEIPPEEEVAPADAEGNVIGRVAVQYSEGLRYAGRVPLIEAHQPCEYASPVVGKVYAVYSCPARNDQTFIGSGFKVSPSIVLTCAHVCTPQRMIDGDGYTLKQFYVTFKADTTAITLQPQAPQSCHPLVRIPDPALPEQLKYTYSFQGAEIPWKTVDDFVFLRLDDHVSADEFLRRPFVYPSSSPPPHDQLCFVAGYPAGLNRETAKGYTTANFESLYNTFSGFMKKTFSFGKVIGDEGGFIHHDAPTLGGFSGGLFQVGITGSAGGVGFSGIHVGGVLKLAQNFVIPTTNPNLGAGYFQAIIETGEFKSMDKAFLQPYYDLHRSSLPQNVKNALDPFFNPPPPEKRSQGRGKRSPKRDHPPPKKQKTT